MSYKRENSPDNESKLTIYSFPTKHEYTNWTTWRRRLRTNLGDYPLTRSEIENEAPTDWDATRHAQTRVVTYLKEDENGVQQEMIRPWNAVKDD
jgi:hypothetical protein